MLPLLLLLLRQGGEMGQHPDQSVGYFAEQWRLEADGNGWTKELRGFTKSENGTEPGWSPRFGHSTVVEQPNAANSEVTRLYLLGGRDGDG